MRTQYQKLLKELGGSKEEVKALLQRLVAKEILERIKEVLETMGKEERKACQEEHGVKANGYDQRDLFTPMGAIEGLRVPRVRTGNFHPCFLEPHERHLFRLEELIYAMYAGGLCTRDVSPTLKALLESKHSPQKVPSITQKALEKAAAFRKKKVRKSRVASSHLCGWHLPQGEEGRESGRGSGLLSLGDRRGWVQGGAYFLPCFFRGECRGLEGGLGGSQGERVTGTPALHRGWAHGTSPCRAGGLSQS